MEKQLIPQLRFPEFKEKWQFKLFSDVVKVNQGLAILRSDRFSENADNRLPYITIPALEGKIVEYIENPKKSVICKKEDIIITRTGSGLGQIWTNNYGVFHNNFFKVEPIKKDEDYKGFLYYYLLTKSIQNKMWLSAGVGAIPDLNHGDFYSLPYFKTKIEEQKKIASFLSDVDDKIAQLTKKKALLEQYKKGIMQKIFSQELRFKDDEGNPFPDWEQKSMGDIGTFQTSSVDKLSKSDEQEVFLVNYMNVYRHETVSNETVKSYQVVTANDNQLKSSNLLKGDLLFTPSSETPTDIGHSVVIFEDINNAVYSYHLIRFRPSTNVLRQLSRFSTGSTRFTISIGNFSKVKVCYPCVEEQTKIANLLSDIDLKIEAIQSKIENTQAFKKGLLQQMFVR